MTLIRVDGREYRMGGNLLCKNMFAKETGHMHRGICIRDRNSTHCNQKRHTPSPRGQTMEESACANSAPESENAALLEAARLGQSEEVERLIANRADPAYQDPLNGVSPLMAAAGSGHSEIVSMLITCGVPWNAMDRKGNCAGNYAILGRHQSVVDQLVGAGVTAELLLRTLSRRKRTTAKTSDSTPDDRYLSMGVNYDEEKLVDETGRGVMMEWERPLMQAHASVLCSLEESREESLDVLNIGFGMGIIDTIIQEYVGKTVRTHTIIEAHPLVQQKMLKDGWDKKPGVKLVFGRWQDSLADIGPFDSIFFDTFGEEYEDMNEFHQHLPSLLRVGGLYSFFNGMCPGNFFFHAVACELCKIELGELGFDAQFVPCNIECDPAVWERVKIQYWSWDTYYLPLCRRIQE